MSDMTDDWQQQARVEQAHHNIDAINADLGLRLVVQESPLEVHATSADIEKLRELTVKNVEPEPTADPDKPIPMPTIFGIPLVEAGHADTEPDGIAISSVG